MNRTRAASRSGLLSTASAVAGKTLRTFARTPQLIGATMGQGVLFLVVFRYVLGGAIDSGALSYVDYMTPGIVTASVMFAAAGAAVGVAEDRADGFTERVLALPTSRTGLWVGRVAADTAVVTGAALVTVVVAAVLGFTPQAPRLHLAAAAVLLALYGLAFSALFGTLGALADGPQTAQSFGFLAIPLTFISSAYVPTETMPASLSAVAENQPVTHMVEALRYLTHPDAFSGAEVSIFQAVAWALVLAVASLMVSRRRDAAA